MNMSNWLNVKSFSVKDEYYTPEYLLSQSLNL